MLTSTFKEFIFATNYTLKLNIHLYDVKWIL